MTKWSLSRPCHSSFRRPRDIGDGGDGDGDGGDGDGDGGDGDGGEGHATEMSVEDSQAYALPSQYSHDVASTGQAALSSLVLVIQPFECRGSHP